MLRLFVIFFVLMFAEIWLWRELAPHISWGIILIATLVAIFVGSSQIRKGLVRLQQAALSQAQSGAYTSQGAALQGIGAGDSLKALALIVSGFLLILPGFLSDIAAVLVLLPPVQTLLGKWMRAIMAKNQQAILARMQQMQAKQGGAFGSGAFGGGATGNPFGGSAGQNPFGGQSPFGGQDGAPKNPFEGMFGGGFGRPANDDVIEGEATDVTPRSNRLKDVSDKKDD